MPFWVSFKLQQQQQQHKKFFYIGMDTFAGPNNGF